MRLSVLGFCLVLMFVPGGKLNAGPWAKIVEELAERAASTEGRSAERLIVLRDVKEAPEILTRQMGSKLDEATLLRRFERLQGGGDPALQVPFKALPAAEREIVVELGEGAQRVLRLHPGQNGARLLQHLDVAGLAESRTYGDFVIDGMAWLESPEALAVLRSPIPDDAGTAIAKTLGLKGAPTELSEQDVSALWKSVVRKTGDGAGEFWRTYVARHKGKWLVGGLLVTYLAMPERFHDGAGKLTEYGTRAIGKLLGDTVLGAGQGFIQELGESVRRHYKDAPVTTVLTLGMIVVLLLAAVPRVRRAVCHRLLRGVFASRAPQAGRQVPNTADKSELRKHTPLQE